MKRYRPLLDKIREVERLSALLERSIGDRPERPLNWLSAGRLSKALERYLAARLTGNADEARAGLVDYLDSTVEIVKVCNDDMLNRAAEALAIDFRGAVESIGTEDQDALFCAAAKRGAPRLSPLRIQHLAQVAAAVTHAMEFPIPRTADKAGNLVVEQLTADQEQKLRGARRGGASGAPLWKYLLVERTRILRGERGLEARLKHDHYLARIPPISGLKVDYRPYLELHWRIEKPKDYDAMLARLDQLRPKPRPIKK